MNDFEKAILELNQKPKLCAIVHVTAEGEIDRIVDVAGSEAQARILTDTLNERCAKALHPYQWVGLHDFDVHGKFVETTKLTVFKGLRAESALALRRSPWLRKMVERLDRWFTR